MESGLMARGRWFRSQLPSEKLGELFDEQFCSVFNLIDEQIHLLGTKYPNEHLVRTSRPGRTSLTSSDVHGSVRRTRFLSIYPEAASSAIRHCCGNALSQCTGHANFACRTAVSACSDAVRRPKLTSSRQLAVVQGMVMDRIQALSRGTVIYKERCCRQSYGVVSREPYDAVKHRGEKVSLDPLDKKRWAEGQIFWIIKKVRGLGLFLHRT
jgi:hypothetical protein